MRNAEIRQFQPGTYHRQIGSEIFQLADEVIVDQVGCKVQCLRTPVRVQCGRILVGNDGNKFIKADRVVELLVCFSHCFQYLPLLFLVAEDLVVIGRQCALEGVAHEAEQVIGTVKQGILFLPCQLVGCQ